LTQETSYPWDGRVAISVSPDQPRAFALRVRIPGWSVGQPVPGDLYHYLGRHAAAPRLTVCGDKVPVRTQRGFVTLERRWKAGDTVVLDLPMPVRRVIADQRVEAARHRVALERGPIVYCVEEVDVASGPEDLVLGDDVELGAEHRAELLDGVTVIRGKALRAERREGAEGVLTHPVSFLAIPYYGWNHRKPGAMAVWLPRTLVPARVRPSPTVASRSRASASHCWQNDTVTALNDLVEPRSSKDHDIPRLTWWNHKGSREWVQYLFEKPTRVSGVSVYWFDDTGIGQCRVPASWRVLSLRDGKLRPVENPTPATAVRDRFNATTFDPVVADGLRIEAKLQKGFSGGILEWKVK
jgi:hypothetical protein